MNLPPHRIARSSMAPMTTRPNNDEKWSVISRLVASTRTRARFRVPGLDLTSDFCRWIIVPVPGYVEVGSVGPFPQREVEWVEIRSVMVRKIHGVETRSEHLEEIRRTLDEAGIRYEIQPGDLVRAWI